MVIVMCSQEHCGRTAEQLLQLHENERTNESATESGGGQARDATRDCATLWYGMATARNAQCGMLLERLGRTLPFSACVHSRIIAPKHFSCSASRLASGATPLHRPPSVEEASTEYSQSTRAAPARARCRQYAAENR